MQESAFQQILVLYLFGAAFRPRRLGVIFLDSCRLPAGFLVVFLDTAICNPPWVIDPPTSSQIPGQNSHR